jgi:hypothetical protein
MSINDLVPPKDGFRIKLWPPEFLATGKIAVCTVVVLAVVGGYLAAVRFGLVEPLSFDGWPAHQPPTIESRGIFT